MLRQGQRELKVAADQPQLEADHEHLVRLEVPEHQAPKVAPRAENKLALVVEQDLLEAAKVFQLAQLEIHKLVEIKGGHVHQAEQYSETLRQVIVADVVEGEQHGQGRGRRGRLWMVERLKDREEETDAQVQAELSDASTVLTVHADPLDHRQLVHEILPALVGPEFVQYKLR